MKEHTMTEITYVAEEHVRPPMLTYGQNFTTLHKYITARTRRTSEGVVHAMVSPMTLFGPYRLGGANTFAAFRWRGPDHIYKFAGASFYVNSIPEFCGGVSVHGGRIAIGSGSRAETAFPEAAGVLDEDRGIVYDGYHEEFRVLPDRVRAQQSKSANLLRRAELGCSEAYSIAALLGYDESWEIPDNIAIQYILDTMADALLAIMQEWHCVRTCTAWDRASTKQAKPGTLSAMFTRMRARKGSYVVHELAWARHHRVYPSSVRYNYNGGGGWYWDHGKVDVAAGKPVVNWNSGRVCRQYTAVRKGPPKRAALPQDSQLAPSRERVVAELRRMNTEIDPMTGLNAITTLEQQAPLWMPAGNVCPAGEVAL
jgi:hypothetical protein